jgi:hypothetical protein
MVDIELLLRVGTYHTHFMHLSLTTFYLKYAEVRSVGNRHCCMRRIHCVGSTMAITHDCTMISDWTIDKSMCISYGHQISFILLYYFLLLPCLDSKRKPCTHRYLDPTTASSIFFHELIPEVHTSVRDGVRCRICSSKASQRDLSSLINGSAYHRFRTASLRTFTLEGTDNTKSFSRPQAVNRERAKYSKTGRC